jgi:hypothetical protein
VNSRLVLLGVTEHFPDQPSAFTNVFVDDRRRHDYEFRPCQPGELVASNRQSRTFEKVDAHSGGNGTCQEGLSCPWRTVKQNTLWRLNADAQEELGVLQGQFDHLMGKSQL